MARLSAAWPARAAGAGLRDRAAGRGSSCRPETTLIGFAGAPWTVATYMVEGAAEPRFRQSPSAGPMATPALSRADRPAGRGDRRLSLGADRGRRRGAAALRQLGRRACRPASSGAGSLQPTAGDRRRRSNGAASGRAGHRVSRAAPGLLYRRLRERDRRAMRSASTAAVPLALGRARRCSRSWPVQGNLDPLLLLAGGRRWHAGGGEAILDGARRRAASSSISATASCRRRRRRSCGRAGANRAWPAGTGVTMAQDRRRAVQSRRAGPPGRGRAVPVQSVHRSGDHLRCRSRCAGCWRG